MAMAALSYAMAASTAVPKVPTQCRFPWLGSRISEAHLPDLRRHTPRYPWCLFSLPHLPRDTTTGVRAPSVALLLARDGFVLLLLHANSKMCTSNLHAIAINKVIAAF